MTTINRSPITGSVIVNSRPGWSNGMTILARFLPTMLRATDSGCACVAAMSPMVTIQPGPSVSTLAKRGRDIARRRTASTSVSVPSPAVFRFCVRSTLRWSSASSVLAVAIRSRIAAIAST